MDSNYVLELLSSFVINMRDELRRQTEDLPPLRPKDIKVLEYIWNGPDHSVRMADLTNFMEVSPAATSQLINQYELQKLALRIRSTEDRRANFIKIHPDLLTYIDRKKQETVARIDQLMDHLGQEDAQNLLRIIEKVQNYYSNEANQGQGA